VAKINAYGNCFSVMGERAFATHPDIRMKEALGWVSSDQIVNFTTSGDYTIYPLETADTKVKGLRIPLKNEIVLPIVSIQAGRNGPAKWYSHLFGL
jgi:hypothetical protein